jgi:glutamate 5-kinase
MNKDAQTPSNLPRRVVVKVGTNIVTQPDGPIALSRLAKLAEEIGALRAQGVELLLVSSGAVGLGAERLGLGEAGPKNVVDKQACAAAGQGALMGFYDRLFRHLDITVAQMLLTEADFSARERYLNLHQTLERLLRLGALPIINENDTVSIAELEMKGSQAFGDNDRLAALVASRVQADLLVVFTDVDGLYDRPPDQPGAKVIELWDEDASASFGSGSSRGRGGMESKVAAARVAAEAGVEVVIANGLEPSNLQRIAHGERIGTRFPPRRNLNSRRLWLAHATSPTAGVIVNHGAFAALTDGKASLLPTGVVEVEGEFAPGEVVWIRDESGQEFARGVSNWSSTETRRMRGRHSAGIGTGRRERMVVNRENIVILERAS